MSNEKDNKLPTEESRVTIFDAGSSPFPMANFTRNIMMDTVIAPPDDSGGDRTREDRERHKDRIRDQIKPQLPELIGGNPIFGEGGKIKVPVKGGYEPRFRYGRDQKGGGGGGGGEAGSDPGELIYVEISMEELIQMLFEEMELPDMLKKQLATTKVKAHKFRGVQPQGPKPRLKKPETARARVRRAIGVKNANPDKFEHVATNVPTTADVPFARSDMRYHRVEETLDDDSKCVVFFVLDRSGSMGGDPLMIAKSYFLLNLLFLRTKYRDVSVVMIAHDAEAHRIEDEKNFYQIEVAGGTMFVPSYELVFKIAQAEFPSATWNRYMFQATDGVMFDGQDAVRDWYTKLIQNAFNYCGYLEIPAGWGGRGWQYGGQALLGLEERIKAHVGMAQASSLKDVPEAFKQILTKDKKKS